MGEASDTISLENHEFTLYHTADLGNQELLYIPFYFTKRDMLFITMQTVMM